MPCQLILELVRSIKNHLTRLNQLCKLNGKLGYLTLIMRKENALNLFILEENFMTKDKDLEKKYQDFEKKRAYELLNYDKKHHIELLDKLELDDELKSKLRSYSVILIHQLNWEIRDQYLELLENYREEKIDSFNFRIRFSERYEFIDRFADLLESNRVLLSPDKKSLNFGSLLSAIESCCKAYSDDPEPFRNEFEIGEVEFRIRIEKFI